MTLKFKGYKCNARYDQNEQAWVGIIKDHPEIRIYGEDRAELEDEFRYTVLQLMEE